MIIEAKCPKCGGRIKYKEFLDTQFFDNTYYDTSYGECQGCGELYAWEDVYTYDRTINLRTFKDS